MATITTRLTAADHGRPMTLAEFLEADLEEGHRYELARGVVEVTKVPNPDHGLVICHLLRIIARWEFTHPGVIHQFGGGSEFQLLLPALGSGRNPDVGVVFKGSPPDHRGYRPPSLVAEVISPRSRDRDLVAKREEYLAYGIQEYWIVDLPERRLVVLTRDGDTWVEQVCHGDQPIPSRLLSGLTATVADLWIDLGNTDADAD